jgi:YD repeat-containing protein
VAREDRGIAVVDPETGGLWLEATDMLLEGEPDDLILGRSWEGDGWRWRGEARLELDVRGTRLVRQGSPDATFPPLFHDAAEPWCIAGLEFDSDRGDHLFCEHGGYRMLRPDGAQERYDELGHLVERTSAQRELSLSWGQHGLTRIATGDGREISVAEPVVRGSRIERTARGPAGQQVRYEYDEQGHLVAAGNPEGLGHRYLYDPQGRVQVVIWNDGSRLVLRRDDQGRITTMEGPSNQRWRFDWGDDGLERAFDGHGSAWVVTRDARGVSLRDPAGRSATLLMEEGVIQGWRDPAGQGTRLDRDEAGRVSRLITADGARWTLEYDEAGQLSTLKAPTGARWQIHRDRGVLRITDPTGRTRRFRADLRGLVTEIQDGTRRVSIRRDGAGRAVEIHLGSIGSTRIQRDAAGRIVNIVDAGGAETRFTEHLGEHPGLVRPPGGGSWRLRFDGLSRPRSLDTPQTGTIEWVRDASGRIALLRRDQASTRFDRRSDGVITRVVDPLGRISGWTRDAMARVTSWLRPDGSQLLIGRDARGDPRSMKLGSMEIELARDALGRPSKLARTDGTPRDLASWTWDSLGMLRSVVWPQGELTVERDSAGLVKKVSLDGDSWQLDRDAGGKLRSVREASSERSWQIARDSAGLPTGLRGPDHSLELTRDPRGNARTATLFGLKTSWHRDSAARPARIEGPGQVSLGLQYDDAGRLTLARLPGGPLLHMDREGSRRSVRLEDADGVVLYEASLEYDALGRLAVSQDSGGTLHHRYGPLDELSSIESNDSAWCVLPGRLEGPPGTLVVDTTPEGRPQQARIELAAPAWGVARHQVDYVLDERGFVERIEGDSGTAALEHDALGRLVAVSITAPEGGEPVASWTIDWDPFGRPEAIHSGGETTRLGFLEGRLLGVQERGRAALLLGDELLGVLAGEDGYTSLITGAAGYRELALFPQGDPYVAASIPGGLRDLGYPGPLADGGRLQLYPGGPLLGPQDTRDPLSGQPSASAQTLMPWEATGWPKPEERVHWPALDGAASVAWDPEPWSPSGPWGAPLALLVALGELAPVSDSPWWSPLPQAAPLPWLPASIEGMPPGILPPTDALPIQESPVAALFLAAALPPARPVDPKELVRTLLAGELQDLPADLPGAPRPNHIP